jgi:hypothetical protein
MALSFGCFSAADEVLGWQAARPAPAAIRPDVAANMRRRVIVDVISILPYIAG